MTITNIGQKILSISPGLFKASDLNILQVNLGYLCNMACKHCHVSAGPGRTEVMDRTTIEQVLDVLRNNPIETLDITGGAPELNPNFRMLVTEARNAGRRVIVRTNLTIFFEQGMSDLPEFYRDKKVELIASLPCYLENNVDWVRGNGAFKKSIQALRKLNSLGYGKGSSSLFLGLVYNPLGAFFAPDQCMLEKEYKQSLEERFGISFTHLYTIINMPVGRFKETLEKIGNLDTYLEKLAGAFNLVTLDGIMCRHLINVGWDGKLYDCDFNQGLGLTTMSDAPRHISQFDYHALSKRSIAMNDHCYGCTAGSGSSCTGVVRSE